MTTQKTTRQLALLLRRQLAFEKDSLMRAVQDLVDTHFASIQKENLLRGSQLKNLEGFAFSSLHQGAVVSFIKSQASKDRKQNENKPDKQKWISNDLDQKLCHCITEIVGREVGKTTGETGRKDAVMARVKEKAGTEIPKTIVTSWFSPEREQEIQMELLREFASYFRVFYDLKAAELGPTAVGEEDE
jgi:hypothetical protein